MAMQISVLILALAIQAVMGADIPEPKDFFKSINGNLSHIVWAHAVNNRTELEKALASEKVMMLEADVILGTIGDDSSAIPIMGHPPQLTGDLSLSDFLKTVTQNNTKKGIKLDFKSTDAFQHSKDVLKEHRDNFTFPVFINADIQEGPVNSTANSTDLPVDAKVFLTGVAEVLPKAVLSVGWTTRYGSKYNITEGRYTHEQTKKMLDSLAENKVNQTVTYAMRAGLITEDFSVVKKLLENGTNAKNATLTIWSHAEDKVDTDKLSHLIRELGVNNVYVDVPSDVFNKLVFSAAPALGSTMLMTVSTLALAMVFSRIL